MNKVVLITGGARRIGAALCRAFAGTGWRVVIHCHRSRAVALRLARELGGPDIAAVVSGDLCGKPEETLAEAVNVFGRLDGLVNNASTYNRISLDNLTETSLREDFEVNFFAPFTLMQAFAARKKQGFVLNLLDGRIAKQDISAAGYLLAKQTLAEATRLAAAAWAPLGIRVNGLAPGLVRPRAGVALSRMQPLLQKLPLQRRVSEADLTQAALYLATAQNVTGEILFVDSGMHLNLPSWQEK